MKKMKQQTLIAFILGFTLLLFSHYSIAEVKIDKVNDFQRLSAQLRQENIVLVLEFSTKNCRFCKQLEDEILKPMLISGDYNDLVSIKQIALDSDKAIKDFDGSLISGKRLAKRMNIVVAPTLVFLNADGKEVSERIIGINTPEMFSAYVDAAIDEAHQAVLKSKLTRLSAAQLNPMPK
jgi:thioredoxin-related protein